MKKSTFGVLILILVVLIVVSWYFYTENEQNKSALIDQQRQIDNQNNWLVKHQNQIYALNVTMNSMHQENAELQDQLSSYQEIQSRKRIGFDVPTRENNEKV